MTRASLLVSLSVAAAAAIFWLVTPSASEEAPSPKPTSTRTATRTAPDAGRARTDVSRALDDVQRQIDALVDEQDALYEQVESIAAPSDPVAVDPLLDAQQRAEAQMATLDASFTSEAVDGRWAGEAQDALRGALDGTLSGVRLGDARCRASMCRLEIEFDDHEARDAAMRDIPFRLPWSGEAWFSIDPETGTLATIYVAREGGTLPRAS